MPAGRVRAHSFPENQALAARVMGGVLTVENAGIYSVIEF